MNIDETVDKSKQIKPQTEETQKEEEEETLVLIQFTDLDDANYCEQFSNKFKSIDISNKNPIIQIGNRLYSGEYQNNIGTYLFFEENKPQNSSSNNSAHNLSENIVNSNQQLDSETNNTTTKSSSSSTISSQSAAINFNYFGKSYKKLVLSRLFVEEKKENLN